MAFQFKLSTLLRIRTALERLAESQLMAQSAEVAKCRAQLDELHDARLFIKQQFLATGTIEATGAAFHFAHDVEQSLDRRISEAQRKLREAQQLQAALLRSFQARRQDKETVQSLHDHQLSDYQTEAARKLQRELDETHLLRMHLQKDG